MNKVVLIGRLTKDPELKFTPGAGTAVTTFTIAVDQMKKKDGTKGCDFINCVAWNKTAELVANYLTKGNLMGLSGRIQVRNYDAKDGTKRYVTEVIVDEIQFLEKKDKSETSSNSQNKSNSSNNDMVEVLDAGDIPF